MCDFTVLEVRNSKIKVWAVSHLEPLGENPSLLFLSSMLHAFLGLWPLPPSLRPIAYHLQISLLVISASWLGPIFFSNVGKENKNWCRCISSCICICYKLNWVGLLLGRDDSVLITSQIVTGTTYLTARLLKWCAVSSTKPIPIWWLTELKSKVLTH